MKGILKVAGLVLAALLLWGCDKPQKEEPDVPQNPVADFVVEQGTKDVWTYRK